MDSKEIKEALGITDNHTEISLGLVAQGDEWEDHCDTPENFKKTMKNWVEESTDLIMDDWNFKEQGKPTIDSVTQQIIQNIPLWEESFIMIIKINCPEGNIFNVPISQLIKEIVERDENSTEWMEKSWKEYLHKKEDLKIQEKKVEEYHQKRVKMQEEDEERYQLYLSLKEEFEGTDNFIRAAKNN